MNKSEWVWMPHAGHLIVGRDCRFHLSTYIPAAGVVVSTVRDYLPDETVREIHAQCLGVRLKGRGNARLADFLEKCGYMEVGCDRLYETMVFHAKKAEGDSCCPWRQEDGREVDFAGYKTPEAAFAGHMAMCEKWDATTQADSPVVARA